MNFLFFLSFFPPFLYTHTHKEGGEFRDARRPKGKKESRERLSLVLVTHFPVVELTSIAKSFLLLPLLFSSSFFSYLPALLLLLKNQCVRTKSTRRRRKNDNGISCFNSQSTCFFSNRFALVIPSNRHNSPSSSSRSPIWREFLILHIWVVVVVVVVATGPFFDPVTHQPEMKRTWLQSFIFSLAQRNTWSFFFFFFLSESYFPPLFFFTHMDLFFVLPWGYT